MPAAWSRYIGLPRLAMVDDMARHSEPLNASYRIVNRASDTGGQQIRPQHYSESEAVWYDIPADQFETTVRRQNPITRYLFHVNERVGEISCVQKVAGGLGNTLVLAPLSEWISPSCGGFRPY